MLVSRFREENDKLIAADATDGVSCSRDADEALGDGPQKHVTGTVSEAVVDVLEAVDVDVQSHDRDPTSPRLGQQLLCSVDDSRPVQQPREVVVHRLVAQLLLGADQISLGEVLPDRDESGDQRRRDQQTGAREERRVAIRIEQDRESDRHGAGRQPACALR